MVVRRGDEIDVLGRLAFVHSIVATASEHPIPLWRRSLRATVTTITWTRKNDLDAYALPSVRSLEFARAYDVDDRKSSNLTAE